MFADSVDLPTPPLPDATARMLRTPGTDRRPSIGSFAAFTSAETRTSTEATPGMTTASSTAAFISAFFGRAGVVGARSSDAPSRNGRVSFRIMLRLAEVLPGATRSVTRDSAARTPSGVAHHHRRFLPNSPIVPLLAEECFAAVDHNTRRLRALMRINFLFCRAAGPSGGSVPG